MNSFFKSGKPLKRVKNPAVSITFQALLAGGVFVLLLLTVGYHQESGRNSITGHRRCVYLTERGDGFARLLGKLDPSDGLKYDENGGFMSLVPEFEKELVPGVLRVEEKIAVPETPGFVPFKSSEFHPSADLRPLSGEPEGTSGSLPAVLFDDCGREVMRWEETGVAGGMAFIRVSGENIYKSGEVLVSSGSAEVDRKLLQLVREKDLASGGYCAVFPKTENKGKGK